MELLVPLNDAQWAGQNTTYTGTAGTVTGWPEGPQGVVVACTTAAFVRVGPVGSTTATTADTFVAANTPYRFIVPPCGKNWTVSAIQVASGGSVYAKPINRD